ncbi:ArsR/SmtB family transcription factor [Galbibacter pacificus]|uniref:Metalloregulator ArsR/SmtB family transcription factor n=1 Tax=Galbibacter pacificus TaxID=2996052 RepID=A0ABT6FT20_9FLAO|nr:metalloregulator ArsR/SmtB family transcription factor [Galbibacter pacificus]MDG3582460.1 metalloregulator ArsR/SmtB family transcription factor [Galbibacter pacificus]MDG3586422.1 metalloregulator ArsR/SmtB family transcription factor [Galbibacter pacificus]
MGFTKKLAHTLEQNELSVIFKALGHPARISILQYISNHPNCICNDLVRDIDLAQATISQHLVELKKVDLIQGKHTGKKTCYHINIDKLYEVKQSVVTFFDETQ